jgi:hypothetical protein
VNAFHARLPIADVNNQLDASWGEASFFTRVSYFRDFIRTATGGTAVFVPEPSALGTLLLGMLATPALSRRRY